MGILNNVNSQKDIFSTLDRSSQGSFTLRMAPLIDIIFLLLIFFLVTANWRPKESFLPFQLPTASADTKTIVKAEPLIITIKLISAGCVVQIGQNAAVEIIDETTDENLALMMDKLKQCMIQQKRFTSDPIEIVCEREVKWQYLAKIYNLMYGSGLTDITFAMTE